MRELISSREAAASYVVNRGLLSGGQLAVILVDGQCRLRGDMVLEVSCFGEILRPLELIRNAYGLRAAGYVLVCLETSAHPNLEASLSRLFEFSRQCDVQLLDCLTLRKSSIDSMIFDEPKRVENFTCL